MIDFSYTSEAEYEVKKVEAKQVMADRFLIQCMQDVAYALLIQHYISEISGRSGCILNSEVYDATSDIWVEDLVFMAINKENGLTIEGHFVVCISTKAKLWIFVWNAVHIVETTEAIEGKEGEVFCFEKY